jgi:glutaredoxin
MAKKFMKEKGVEYQELDVSSDTTARQEMMDVSGQMGVPVIVIDGQVIIGFNQQRLGELLRAA